MDEEEQVAVPVIEEELVTGTREVKTGSVRIHKEVERVPTQVEMPALQDVVEVSRVAVNRVVETMPTMREEGDLLIVPVVEEELVVEKRMVLREEIHIRRRRVQKQITKTIILEKEYATVERLDAEGNVIAVSKPDHKSLSDREIEPPLQELTHHKSLFD